LEKYFITETRTSEILMWVKKASICLITWKEPIPISHARYSMSYKTKLLLVLLSSV